MKAKVKLNFKIKIDNKIKNFEIGDFIETDDEDFVNKYSEKGILEIVPIMDTKTNALNSDDEHEYSYAAGEYLTNEELKKLKTKADVIKYGESIGIAEIDNKLKREDIEDLILEHIANLNAPTNYLTLDQLQELGTVDDLIEYAISIGVDEDIINAEQTREEFENAIIDYIAKLEVENENI